MSPDWTLEQTFWTRDLWHVAGIDEAGRGAWAGPVTVAAVILPPAAEYPFDDSKQLSAARRQKLVSIVKEVALAYAVVHVPAEIIDKINVLQATKQGALQALAQLSLEPQALITDYLPLPTDLPILSPPKADSLSYSVAAASLLAKTTRDELMLQMAEEYPAYGFEKHKGYGSLAHRAALAQEGICPLHRRSFAPIRALLNPPLFSLANPNPLD